MGDALWEGEEDGEDDVLWVGEGDADVDVLADGDGEGDALAVGEEDEVGDADADEDEEADAGEDPDADGDTDAAGDLAGAGVCDGVTVAGEDGLRNSDSEGLNAAFAPGAAGDTDDDERGFTDAGAGAVPAGAASAAPARGWLGEPSV
jgi:hypothetical protein